MRQYHVSPQGAATNGGTADAPLRTISAAAALAEPGDTIIVHAGTYRERVDPPRGGFSDDCRIVYQAMPGEVVEIKGSEIIDTWEPVEADIWCVSLPNSFFGADNPYRDPLSGHWFLDKGRNHHRGAVYLNGHWLAEAARKEDVFSPTGDIPLWFAEVDKTTTTIWAQFAGICPNEKLVEINVRQTVFYPSKPGLNYLTVRGFSLSQAATPWAPPTTEQVGCIGTNWSKGWIIEDNVVSYSVCSGITLGKYNDPEDCNDGKAVEGTAGSDIYIGTIHRALNNGWRFDSVGHHIVRNNHISHCEMAGICGSLGALASLVEGNIIHDIHVRQLFGGAEMAGIKFHGAIDTVIRANRIYRCIRGLWLDWMSQGTRVTGNLFYGNGPEQDIFLEVNHGPFIVDSNLLLSRRSILNWSHGGLYAHNLLLGSYEGFAERRRYTPYHKAHSTELAGLLNHELGDDRVLMNIFNHPSGTSLYDEAALPSIIEDNVYLGGARPSQHDKNPLKNEDNVAEALGVQDLGKAVYLNFAPDSGWARALKTRPVSTGRLGRARVPDLPFENPDGSSLVIDTDYFRQARDDQPFPGPFALAGQGYSRVRVWPVSASSH